MSAGKESFMALGEFVLDWGLLSVKFKNRPGQSLLLHSMPVGFLFFFFLFFLGRILGFVMSFKTVNLSLIIKSMEIQEEAWAFSRDYLLLWIKAGFEKQFSQAPEGWLICHFSTEVNERRSNASKHSPFKDLQTPSNLEHKQQDLWVAGSVSGTSK